MDSSTNISDDDFYQVVFRNLTKEEEMEYFRALAETEGFDVPDFGYNIFAFGLITPIELDESLSDNPSLVEEIWISTNEAIKHYNNKNGTNFEVVDIVKVNHGGSRRAMYYITFNVKPKGTSREFPKITFEAKVFYGIPTPTGCIEVELCRPKSSN